MAKIRNPCRFSEHFGVDANELEQRGVLDPTLNADTRLFIDPLLLAESEHAEISGDGRTAYEKHFSRIVRLLQASGRGSSVAFKGAKRLLSFPEVKWTCLGYGSQSVSGSGSGSGLTAQYIETAAEIIALGVEDPDLFVAMALFEEGVGADRISDMTTNVIIDSLLQFNERILGEIGVPRRPLRCALPNGRRLEGLLAENPFLGQGEPVILVPSDVLSALPVATDWSAIGDVAARNTQLRAKVNWDVSRIWETMAGRKNKRELRGRALASKESFDAFLEVVRGVRPRKYDLALDPKGQLVWRDVATKVALDEPRAIAAPAKWDRGSVEMVVGTIVEQFRFLVEERRLGRELYSGGKRRPEKSAQMLFFAVAYAYCKANNLDLTPEAETGNGPVDFKVSSGFRGRTLVEIKLSSNTSLVKGYTKQVEAYSVAEETTCVFFVVVDVGGLGQKYDRIVKTRNEAARSGGRIPTPILVDAKPRPSASRR